MNNLYIFVLLFLSYNVCLGQNLVPNGDFEDYTNCPQTYSNLWVVTSWTNPSAATPDYMNQCAPYPGPVYVPYNFMGYQMARSGVGYAGIYTYLQLPAVPEQKEYIQVGLLSPLIAGTIYHFEMYVSHANYSGISIADIGVYFSNYQVSVSHYFNLPFIPQIENTSGIISDTSQWTLVSGIYSAVGGETHLIIGNFKDDTSTTYQWTSNYANKAYYYIDDVSLSVATDIDEQNINTIVKLYPNPVDDYLTVNSQKELGEIKIYDVVGKLIYRELIKNYSAEIGVKELDSGVYFLEAENFRGKFVKE